MKKQKSKELEPFVVSAHIELDQLPMCPGRKNGSPYGCAHLFPSLSIFSLFQKRKRKKKNPFMHLPLVPTLFSEIK
jgi:hypothetical protein